MGGVCMIEKLRKKTDNQMFEMKFNNFFQTSRNSQTLKLQIFPLQKIKINFFAAIKKKNK